MIGKIIAISSVAVLMLGGCATGLPEDKIEVVEVSMPENRDEAAQFVISSKQERWSILQHDDGLGNKLYANQKRITQSPNGISSLWLQVAFSQPVPLAEPGGAMVAASLLYTEVKCSDNSFRTPSYYAVSPEGKVLEVVHSNALFSPLDAGAVGLSIYHFACEQ